MRERRDMSHSSIGPVTVVWKAGFGPKYEKVLRDLVRGRIQRVKTVGWREVRGQVRFVVQDEKGNFLDRKTGRTVSYFQRFKNPTVLETRKYRGKPFVVEIRE